jgi:hypothetical protein
MIVSSILNLVYSVIAFLIGLFPDLDTTIVEGLTSAIGQFNDWAGTWFNVFSFVTTFATVVGFLLVFEGFILGFHIINFIINKIRGSG